MHICKEQIDRVIHGSIPLGGGILSLYDQTKFSGYNG